MKNEIVIYKKLQKLFLIVGVITLGMSLCIIFPLEQRNANTIDAFDYTYVTLTIALLTIMYGLIGKAFFKGLLFLLFSASFSFCTWLLLYPSGWLFSFVAFWGGIPSGIIAGLIFMLINFEFIKDEDRYKLFFKRLISYLLILFIVSYLFNNGEDWIFEISKYFKSKKEQPQSENLKEKPVVPLLENKDTTRIAHIATNTRNGHVAASIINGEKYIALFDVNSNFYIINTKKDIIFKAINEFGPDFSFVDFNRDGYNDILFNYITNVPGINDLIIYDKKTVTFKAVKNFSDYPDSKPILNTKYFYSYHRSGCADMSWDSDLFYIKNFKAHKLANISVDCGTDSLVINKVIDGDKKIYKVLSESKALEEINKWAFIEQYWKKNYQKFVTNSS